MDTRNEYSDEHVQNPDVLHEASDINVRGVLGFGIGLVLCGLLICLVLVGMFKFLRAGFTPKPINTSPILGVREPIAPEKAPTVFPEPRLQVNYFQDMDVVRDQWNSELHSYGWLDKNNGITHIPIEKAMELTLQRGLPVRSEAGQTTAAAEKKK